MWLQNGGTVGGISPGTHHAGTDWLWVLLLTSLIIGTTIHDHHFREISLLWYIQEFDLGFVWNIYIVFHLGRWPQNNAVPNFLVLFSFACKQDRSRELEERISLSGDSLSSKLSMANTVLIYTCENLLGLHVLPNGPGCQVASCGTGLEPLQQGSGDRMQGLCRCPNWERRLSCPTLGTEGSDITSHLSRMMQW